MSTVCPSYRYFDEISIDCVVFAVSVYFSIHVNSLLYYHASPMGAGGVMFVTCPSACWCVLVCIFLYVYVSCEFVRFCLFALCELSVVIRINM